VVRVFIVIKRYVKRFLVLSFCISLWSCSADDRVDDPIPFESFPDVVFNISLPSYSALLVDGGHIVISSFNGQPVGVRGIIVYRENATTFRAFEQTCSFQPYEAASNVQPFATHMQCSGCSSNFDYEGNTSGNGPAWRPLGQYKASVSGSTVTITDEIINY
jgi:hypothetical protein